MTRDTTANESTDGASTGIETRRGCCGGEPTQEESTCGGGEPADDPGGIETRQGCCSDEPTEDDSTCCGEPSTEQSSCCGDSSCGDEDPSDGVEGVAPEAGQKSPTEHDRIGEAAEHTEALLAEMARTWAPDWTEADVAEYLHDRMRETGVEPAWSPEYCPSVHAGGAAEVGHTLPSDRTVPAGELLHVDFGVSHEGYAADLQRVYYYPPDPDAPVPDDLSTAFADVRAAVDAGLAVLEPGVAGHEVDAAAREALSDRGWFEFNHAFGHQVGRDAHDGGTLLGPLWDRYGDRPRGEVQAGEVYSVELGVGTTYGYVGQEEMVRVVEDGTEFVVEPQTDIRVLEGR